MIKLLFGRINIFTKIFTNRVAAFQKIVASIDCFTAIMLSSATEKHLY